MKRNNIMSLSVIAVVVIMAITCPGHRDHKNQLYKDYILYAREKVKQANLNELLSEIVFKEVDKSVSECVSRTSYYNFIVVSICAFEGRPISIGVLGNVITHLPEEDQSSLDDRLQQLCVNNPLHKIFKNHPTVFPVSSLRPDSYEQMSRLRSRSEPAQLVNRAGSNDELSWLVMHSRGSQSSKTLPAPERSEVVPCNFHSSGIFCKKVMKTCCICMYLTEINTISKLLDA